jgi:hypothetical protein
MDCEKMDSKDYRLLETFVREHLGKDLEIQEAWGKNPRCHCQNRPRLAGVDILIIG